jgi:hypothetical protein
MARVHEKPRKDRSEKIIFRVSPSLKAFAKEYSEKMGLDLSDFMRLVLEYYWMAFFTQTGSYKEIREKFFSMYPNNREKINANSE